MASHDECMESAELLPLEHSTSVVWKFFGFPSRDGKIIETDKKKRRRVYCKLCRRNYSYVGNTSNMWQHLEESHVEEFHKAKEDAPLRSLALLNLPVIEKSQIRISECNQHSRKFFK